MQTCSQEKFGFVCLSSTDGLQNFLEFLEWDAFYGLSENAGSITLLIRTFL